MYNLLNSEKKIVHSQVFTKWGKKWGRGVGE